jgi:hypothetical protein
VLKRIFVSKRDEVTGGSRKLHNEELDKLYSSPSIIRMMKSMKMRWAGHVARRGGRRGMHIGCWLESQKERDHWEDQDVGEWTVRIKMDLRERGWDRMDWTYLAEDRDQWRALVNTVMSLLVT